MALSIRNGNVFLEGQFIKTNLLLENSKINKIGSSEFKGTIIDASNLYVLPGMIDIHVHFRDFGQEYKEDWVTASSAAASGGVTTVFDMPNNLEPIFTKKLLDEKRDIVSKKSFVNFGLYIAINDENPEAINQAGIKFVKLYYGMTVGDIKVNNVESIFKRLNKDILIVIHAEDNFTINQNKKKFDLNMPRNHSLVRDNYSEFIAVKTLIELCRKYGNKIHLTHIGTKESMELIIKAKKEGVNVTCDTCPQYLFLDDSVYERLGNKAKVNPPLRSKLDKNALWTYLNDGHIDCLCSDHAPHTIEEKNLPYGSCPPGFPGVETTLKLMLTAINEKKISLERFTLLMTKNPAKIFGIKNKGQIKEGFDADITIVDLDKKSIIEGKKLFTKVKWSPFEGFKIKGDVAYTIVNGNIVYDGKIHSENLGKEVILL